MAPDALTAISASFMKDYKRKAPFSRPPKPTSKAPFMNSFASASTGTHIHSIQSGMTSHSSNTNLDLATHLEVPQEPSEQASRNQPPQRLGQSFDRVGLTSGNSFASSSSQSMKTPTQNSLPCSNGTYSAPPSLPLALPVLRRQGKAGPSTTPSNPRHFQPRSSHQMDMNGRNASSHISKESVVQASGQNPIPYTSISGSRNPNSSTGRNTNNVDYNVMLVVSETSADSAIVVSSPPTATRPVTALPTVTNTSSHTEASRPQQTGPQTAGVKRRLGMGRSTTGYSNKKFKKLV